VGWVSPDDAGLVALLGLEGACFGVFDGEDAGVGFVLDFDGGYGGGEEGFVLVGEEEDGLVGMVDVLGGEAGVVFGEVDDGVLAGDVGGGDDGVFRPVDGVGEGDGEDAAAGDGGAHGGSVDHAGQGDVVDILGLA